VTNRSKDAVTQNTGIDTRIVRTSSQQTANNSSAQSLSGKLRRKRELTEIKIENEESESVNDNASNTINIKTELKAEVKIEPGVNQITDEAVQGNVWHPPLWKQQLDNIYEIRKAWDAPVDTMGCDVISDENAKPEVQIFMRNVQNVLYTYNVKNVRILLCK
jgi:hypothetical protein